MTRYSIKDARSICSIVLKITLRQRLISAQKKPR
jgi:hypothetical protein